MGFYDDVQTYVCPGLPGKYVTLEDYKALQAQLAKARGALEGAASELDDYSPLTGNTVETVASRSVRKTIALLDQCATTGAACLRNENLRALVEKSRAVISRWDSTDWKAPPTAEVMNELRAALAALQEGRDAEDSQTLPNLENIVKASLEWAADHMNCGCKNDCLNPSCCPQKDVKELLEAAADQRKIKAIIKTAEAG
jgi:hypothetical protein